METFKKFSDLRKKTTKVVKLMTSLWPQISGRGYGNSSSPLWEPTFSSSWAMKLPILIIDQMH